MQIKKCKHYRGGLVGAVPLAILLSFPMHAEARDGLFFGVGAGWSGNNVKIDLDQMVEIDGIAADGMAGMAFAGYGWQGVHGFFAVEANLGTRTADAEIKAGMLGKAELEASTSYGLGVLIGSTLEGVSPYLRLGWQVANYEVKDFQSDDQNHDGFRYGVGTLLPLRNDLDLRLEWSQTRYGEEDYFDSGITLEPTENLFSLALSLHY